MIDFYIFFSPATEVCNCGQLEKRNILVEKAEVMSSEGSSSRWEKMWSPVQVDDGNTGDIRGPCTFTTSRIMTQLPSCVITVPSHPCSNTYKQGLWILQKISISLLENSLLHNSIVYCSS